MKEKPLRRSDYIASEYSFELQDTTLWIGHQSQTSLNNYPFGNRCLSATRRIVSLFDDGIMRGPASRGCSH